MRILIINVSLRPYLREKLLPIGLAYIATAIRNAGFSFEILDLDAHGHDDAYVRQYLSDGRFDVVCMGCIVTGYRLIRKYAAMIREASPRATIIVGNTVADSVPHILLSRTEADIAVIGEGDRTIVDLLEVLREGRSLETVKGIAFRTPEGLVRTEPRPVIRDLSSIPAIDYSLWDMDIYIEGFRPIIPWKLLPPTIPQDEVRGMCINTARGCVHKCTFCYHVFRGSPYRHRPWDRVLDEIRFLMERYRINYFAFFDDLTFNTRRSVLEFIEAIRKSGLEFFWEADCRGDLFTRPEDVGILRTARDAGCIRMLYSLESADPGILRSMGKRITPEQFSYQSRLFKEAGLSIGTSLVFGFPGETPETIRKTIDCCIENGVYPSPGFLLPLPGSPMYQWVLDHGFIGDEEEYLLKLGDRQDLRINITGMTDEEFTSVLHRELRRANKALGAGLGDDQLLKTQPRNKEGSTG